MDEDYPSSDIIGHYYVYADRTYEHTIVDKGTIAPLGDADSDNYKYVSSLSTRDIASFQGYEVESLQLYGYLSPQTLFDDRQITGDYISVEKVFKSDTNGLYALRTRVAPNEVYNQPINVTAKQWTFVNYSTPTEINYLADEWLYLLKSENARIPNYVYSFQEEATIENRSINSTLMILHLLRPFEEVADHTDPADFFEDGLFRTLHVAVKRDVDVFANLTQLDYRRIGDTFTTRPSDHVGS
jgi:hypothetical protein